MNIIIDNLEPEILEKLQNQAITHGRTLREEIKLILTKEANQPILKTPESLGWSQGFFEEVIGGWQGEPLTRAKQEDIPMREELL